MQHGHMKFTFIPMLSTYASTTQARADLIRKGSSRDAREKRNDNNNDYDPFGPFLLFWENMVLN
jgi:hypothetical protein